MWKPNCQGSIRGSHADLEKLYTLTKVSKLVSAFNAEDQSRTSTLNFLTLQSSNGRSCKSPIRITLIPSICAVSSSRLRTAERCGASVGSSDSICSRWGLGETAFVADFPTEPFLGLALAPLPSDIFFASALPISCATSVFISEALFTIWIAIKISRSERRRTKGSMCTSMEVREDPFS